MNYEVFKRGPQDYIVHLVHNGTASTVCYCTLESSARGIAEALNKASTPPTFALQELRRDKAQPIEVILPECSDCGASAVNPNMGHCMNCGASQTKAKE